MASLTFETYIDLNTRKIRVKDITNYPAQGLDPANQRGIIKLTTPAGVYYNNNDYTAADIVHSSSLFSGWIVLPTNLNVFIIGGNYTVQLKTRDNTSLAESTNQVVYTYNFTIPETVLTHTVDGYTSTFESRDNTAYGTYSSLTRVHTVTPPTGSSLAATSNANQTISYPANIWSGLWTSTLTSTVRYIQLDSLILDYVFTKTTTSYAYKIDMSVVTDYMEDLIDDWKRLVGQNRMLAAQKYETVTKVYAAYGLYDSFLYYGRNQKAYEQAVEIVELLNDYIPDDEASQEILPFETDVPVSGGLTAEQAAQLIAAYNHSQITGNSSIHHQHPNYTAINGIVNTGGDSDFLAKDGAYYPLQRTIPATGSYTEANLDGNRQIIIGHPYNTLTPRFSLWNGAGKEIKELNVDVVPINTSQIRITHYESPIVGTYKWAVDGIANSQLDVAQVTDFVPADGVDLTRRGGTWYNLYTQTGALNITILAGSIVSGNAVLPILLNGNSITITGADKDPNSGDASTINGETDRYVLWKDGAGTWYGIVNLGTL